MVEFDLPHLKEGMAVETRIEASQIDVFNLQKDDNNNVMIHIRVDQNRLVLNSRSNGAWGREEYFNKSGIGEPGKLITLRAEVTSGHFHVIINGDDHYDFKYRLPYTDVNMGVVSKGIKYYTVFL